MTIPLGQKFAKNDFMVKILDRKAKHEIDRNVF